MIDITLIREKPEWVKQQIAKLNDATAVGRIDAILELDVQRRALLTENEAIQANRNKLNKSMGRLRGDKKMDDATRGTLALRATEAIIAGDYDAASEIMTGQAELTADDTVNTQNALDHLLNVLREMGDKVGDLNDQI